MVQLGLQGQVLVIVLVVLIIVVLSRGGGGGLGRGGSLLAKPLRTATESEEALSRV